MKKIIKAYIYERILNKEREFTDDTPLYSNGILTSMSHIKLINFLERNYNISISTSKIKIDEFDTLNQITQFVRKKLA